MSVLLPALGKPTRPTSASSFSCRRSRLLLARLARLHLARRPVGGAWRSARCPGRRGRPWQPARAGPAREVGDQDQLAGSSRSSRTPPCRPAPELGRAAVGRCEFEPSPCAPRSALNSGWKRKWRRVLRCGAGDEVDRPAVAAVAAVRPAARDELLAAEAQAAAPAMAGRDVDFDFVDEHGGDGKRGPGAGSAGP